MNFASGSIRKTAALAVVVLTAFAASAMAAGTLDVILVKAANAGTTDASLKPYLGLLSRSGFKSYQVVTRKTTMLAAGVVTLAQGFKATLGEASGNRVPVTISREDKDLIRTTLNFAPGRPVILGTYDGDNGAKMILVLVLQE
jgi:hypothetical protein